MGDDSGVGNGGWKASSSVLMAADSGGGSNGAHLVAKGSDTWSPSLSVAAAVGGGIGGGQRLMAAALVACSG
jgi:hypothetical protein